MQTIANYMTKQPWSVQIDDSVAVALRMLAECEIHHLPVLDGGRLVGMVTARGLSGARDRTQTVESVMTLAEDVDASMAFSDALDRMVVHQRDALVVTSGGRVEGIFTAMDAVRALRERMRARPRVAAYPR